MRKTLLGKDCGLDCVIRDHLQQCASDGLIDPHATDPEADPVARKLADALIAMCVRGLRTVEDAHHSRAAATSHEARKQSSPTTGAFSRSALLHMRILRERLLVFLKLSPADVPRVMVLQQDVPGLHRL